MLPNIFEDDRNPLFGESLFTNQHQGRQMVLNTQMEIKKKKNAGKIGM